MKWLIALGITLLCGMAGVIVFHHSKRTEVGTRSGSLGQRVATISHGERVDLAEHLVDGRLTVVEFYADW